MANPRVNKNFRNTASGTKLGHDLFSGKNVQPTQITTLLKQAGFPVPDGVVIAADTAQIIMAGGAVATAASTGASIGAYVNPTAAAIQATVSIMEITGLLDAQDPTVQLLQLGTEVALVASSLGTNVIADIALISDLYTQFSKTMPDLTDKLQGMSDKMAKSAVSGFIQKVVSQENQITAQNFAALQNSKISIFELMGNLANKDTYTFYNYFPDAKAFFPPSYIDLIGQASISYGQQGGAFGLSSKDYNVYSTFEQKKVAILTRMSPEEIIRAIILYFLTAKTDMVEFQMLNQGNTPDNSIGNPYYIKQGVNKISVGDMAALSLCAPYFDTFSIENDLSPNLSALAITPFDMGYDFLQNAATDSDIFKDLHKTEGASAVTFNGVDKTLYPSKNYLDVVKSQQQKVDNLVAYDKAGNISGIVKTIEGRLAIKKFSSFESIVLASGKTQTSFNLRDFWAILSLAEAMSQDKYLNSIPGVASSVIDKMVSGTTGLSESVDDRAKYLQFLNVGRNMNKLALMNISRFFGTTPNKIKLYKPVPGQLAKVVGS